MQTSKNIKHEMLENWASKKTSDQIVKEHAWALSPRSNHQRCIVERRSADDRKLPMSARELVEPAGIEPATSCLQSRRSPS
jgi:hypothetical protein